GHSFLFSPRGTPLPASYSAAILSFNLAVWRFRTPVRYAALERDPSWRIARVGELADTILSRPHPSRQKALLSPADARVSHDADLQSLSPTSAVCYTDGSASPNPGPSGSGAAISTSVLP